MRPESAVTLSLLGGLNSFAPSLEVVGFFRRYMARPSTAAHNENPAWWSSCCRLSVAKKLPLTTRCGALRCTASERPATLRRRPSAPQLLLLMEHAENECVQTTTAPSESSRQSPRLGLVPDRPADRINGVGLPEGGRGLDVRRSG